MIGAYVEGKDLYATVAAGIYHNGYWDNMEHYEDGTPNPEGKKRRSKTKSIILGIMYGRGPASIADQIGTDIKEAQKIIDDFYGGFPKVKQWMDKTEKDAKENGYVEDFWGRRRRLPDIQLPRFTIKDRNQKNTSNLNPLLGSKGLILNEVNPKIKKYEELLLNAKGYKQVDEIKEKAKLENIDITNNGGFIAQAERQCVNARVQGGAATMSKLAMIKVYQSKELRDLGFRMLLQVHDELIGECPKENADKVAEVLTSVMKEAAKPTIQVPFKCDADVAPCWYYNDFKDGLMKDFNKKLEAGELKNDAFNEIAEEHTECTLDQIHEFLEI